MHNEPARLILPVRENWMKQGKGAFLEYMALQDTGNIVRDVSRLEQIEYYAIMGWELEHGVKSYEKEYWKDLRNFLDGN
jgi:hypothetical protein